ncbi:MAG TPA: hypothetical protein ENM97_01465 [Moorella mulderi]|nr:hypothetical protein [Moorella mulderi]
MGQFQLGILTVKTMGTRRLARGWLSILAATLEYFSSCPTGRFLGEYLPLEEWRQKGGIWGWLAARLYPWAYSPPKILLPWMVRRLLSRWVPGYDPHLRAWLKESSSKKDYPVRQKIARLVKEGKLPEAYAYFWSTRRSPTSKRLLLPLYALLGGKRRPFFSTLGVFFTAGFSMPCGNPCGPSMFCYFAVIP